MGFLINFYFHVLIFLCTKCANLEIIQFHFMVTCQIALTVKNSEKLEDTLNE